MATTLTDMISLLRQRTNMENNQFVTDQELTSYLNNSLCLLDGILISKFNDYKLSAVLVSVVDGHEHIDLPADFLKLRGLDIFFNEDNPDGYITLNEFSFRQRNKRPFPITGPLVYGPYQMEYRLQGNYIKLIPGQIANKWRYRLWYTPDFIKLVNGSDTLEPYMDSQSWYEYAICEASIKVLLKQDLDASQFVAQSAQLKDHILKLSAPNRNSAEPAAIVDTRGTSDAGGGYGWNW